MGFRYFKMMDLLGFVDGTANPVGDTIPDSVLVAQEDIAPSVSTTLNSASASGSEGAVCHILSATARNTTRPRIFQPL